MPINLAFFELLTAGALWGFGFVAAVWCLESLSTGAITFYRFFFSFLLGFSIVIIRKASRGRLVKFIKEDLIQNIKWSLVPGICLAGTILTQTFGLTQTSATKSAFITILYVVLVPIFSYFLKRSKISLRHWLGVFAALFGVALMLELNEFEISRGDIYTFICAFFAALHIMSIDHFGKKTNQYLLLNSLQGLWCSLFALMLFPFETNWNLGGISTNAILGLTSLTVGSSFLAFFLQFRAQKKIPVHIASVLFLLESPFSGFFSFLLLNERFSTPQILGSVIIFGACLLVVLKQETANS